MLFLKNEAKKWIAAKPEIWEEPAFSGSGKKAIIFSGLDGKRNAALIGLPEGATAKKKVPGIVLIHGGGGGIFPAWVDFWNKQGYAAIAMDTCGAFFDTRGTFLNWPRHNFSGPAGWGAWDQAHLPPKDQWYTHAMASIVKATTILCDLPEVDETRIGMTGISWGGVLAMIAAGIDPRIKADSIIYSSGFLTDENSMYARGQHKMTAAQLKWYREQWDPANFVPMIKCPTQWVAGTNDGCFALPYWQKTIELIRTQSSASRCMKIRWPHSHGKVGERPPEIVAFMNEHLNGGKPLVRLGHTARKNTVLSAPVSTENILSADLLFTLDGKNEDWPDKTWISRSAEIRGGKITGLLPAGWKAAFLSVLSEDCLITTSDIVFAE